MCNPFPASISISIMVLYCRNQKQTFANFNIRGLEKKVATRTQHSFKSDDHFQLLKGNLGCWSYGNGVSLEFSRFALIVWVLGNNLAFEQSVLRKNRTVTDIDEE